VQISPEGTSVVHPASKTSRHSGGILIARSHSVQLFRIEILLLAMNLASLLKAALQTLLFFLEPQAIARFSANCKALYAICWYALPCNFKT
jgi:hypothetical protein